MNVLFNIFQILLLFHNFRASILNLLTLDVLSSLLNKLKHTFFIIFTLDEVHQNLIYQGLLSYCFNFYSQYMIVFLILNYSGGSFLSFQTLFQIFLD